MFLARHIDSIIMLGVGIWVTGVGLGLVRFPTEGAPPFARWFRRNARWIGPLIMAIALLLGAATPS
jgi:hypothetical protein